MARTPPSKHSTSARNYLASSGHSFFVAESHVHYLRELKVNARVRLHFRILAVDDKRIHAWQEMVHEDGWTAALSETMSLHVRMATDDQAAGVAPFPPPVRARIETMARQHEALERPARVGRVMGIG